MLCLKGIEKPEVNFEFIKSLWKHQQNNDIKEFENKIKGYTSNEGLLIGVESRTSSPVFVPRDKETLQHFRSSQNIFFTQQGGNTHEIYVEFTREKLLPSRNKSIS